MKLPDKFEEKMQALLGDEFPEYLSCYEEPRYYGLRVNTNKISVEDFKQKFGLNSDQAYNALKTMLDEGYVYNRNGCFFPDVKLRSRIFMSRIKKGQERFKEKKEEIKEFSKQTKYIPQKF